jgi:enediyne biosynthesis protein E4
VRTIDPRFNRDAYGAELRLHAGEQWMLRIVNPGDSFQSSSDPRAHFGLGASAHYDAINVLWPDGLEEEFPGGAADRSLVLRRGEGRQIRNEKK